MLRIAWPIVLANSSVPLLGLSDTAIIGNVGTVPELGAIALGALIFTFVYWSFGFLRMGTTGFTAQAAGADDEAEVRATLGRALLLAFGIGAAIMALQRPIGWAALEILGGSREVEGIALHYYSVRIWGAPANLAGYALLGTLLGLGRSDQVLKVQLFLNGVNIALDVLFAGVLRWGVAGVALGTALAEWSALVLGLFLVHRMLRARHRDAEPFWPWDRIRDLPQMLKTIGANADIMIRTILLLLGFAWFTNEAAHFGDAMLAANHILLELLSFSAYFLDGYANAAEALVGRAIGAGERGVFDAAVRRSTELAALTAICLAIAVFFLGESAIAALTDLESVRSAAQRYLPFASVYVLLSFAAFQLDGIFIGATRTRDMRNAAMISVAVFLLASRPAIAWNGNDGLWLAFILYVVARALALGARYPALRRSIGPTSSEPFASSP